MKVRFCFSAEQLKNIALVSMVIDHAAVGLIEQSELASGAAWSLCGTAMRLVGRVAFPLFAFMIAEEHDNNSFHGTNDEPGNVCIPDAG